MKKTTLVFITFACIAFTVNAQNSNTEIFEVSTPEVIYSGNGQIKHLHLSPNGEYLSFLEHQKKGLQIHDANGAFVKTFLPRKSESTFNPVHHSWSLDNRHIAVMSQREYWDKTNKYAADPNKGVRSRRSVIEILDLKTGKSNTPLSEKRRTGWPFWQYKKGKQILSYYDNGKISRVSYHTSFKNDHISEDELDVASTTLINKYKSPSKGHHIYKYKHGKKELVTTDAYLNGVLSPKGDRMVYLSAKQKLTIMNLDTKEKTVIGTGTGYSWSPDGAYILFMVTEDDGDAVAKSELFIVDKNGDNIQQITDTKSVKEDYPRWSPDGKSIYFGAMNNNNLYRLTLAIKDDVDPVIVSAENTLSLYPNPARSYINVAIEGEKEAKDILIFDLNGRLTQTIPYGSKNVQRVALDRLSAATYLLSVVYMDGSKRTKKFIKIDF